MALVGLVLTAALPLALLQLALPSCARNYEVTLERVEGHFVNPEYVNPNGFIRIRRLDKSSAPALFHLVNATKAWPSDTEVEATIYEMYDNKPVPGWLKYRKNFCDYITTEKQPVIAEIGRIYEFKHCPILGVYRLENWRPDDRLLPPILPGPDRFMFGLRFTSGPTLIMKYGVVFSVDRSKGKRGGHG